MTAGTLLALTLTATDASITPRYALSSPGMKRPVVYIMASRRNDTLYVGVTSDIGRGAFEHRTGAIDGFTKRYGCTILVWFEPRERMDEAIARGSRSSPAAERISSS